MMMEGWELRDNKVTLFTVRGSRVEEHVMPAHICRGRHLWWTLFTIRGGMQCKDIWYTRSQARK